MLYLSPAFHVRDPANPLHASGAHQNDSESWQQPGEEPPWDCAFTDDVRWGKNEQGQQTVNEYVLLGELGRGSYGRVQLCERRVGDGIETPWRRFAMKIMSKPRLRRLREYVNVPGGGMRKVTAEDKVRTSGIVGGKRRPLASLLSHTFLAVGVSGNALFSLPSSCPAWCDCFAES